MIGISTGRVNESFANRKIGPWCHARWLTLAIRILSLYIRGLAPTNEGLEIKQLAIFIVKVYGTSWFRIKRYHYLHLQPENLFKSVQNIKQQPDNIKKTLIFLISLKMHFFIAGYLFVLHADVKRWLCQRTCNKEDN